MGGPYKSSIGGPLIASGPLRDKHEDPIRSVNPESIQIHILLVNRFIDFPLLLHRVVFGEGGQALCQDGDLIPLDERSAGADALLGAAAGIQ